MSAKTPKKAGRPKHVAQYAAGKEAQQNMLSAMKAVLTTKKQAKEKAA